MMQFKVFRSIYRIEEEWKELVDSSSANVYRTYEYFELLYKLRRYDPYSYLRNNWRCYFVVAFENSEAKAIAPLILDKHPKKVFHMLGHSSSIGNADFIYKEERCGRELFYFVKESFLKGVPLELWRIDEGSFLVRELHTRLVRPAMKAEVKDFGSYYQSLSKKERRNYRQSLNRLEKDCAKWRVVSYRGGDPLIGNVIRDVVKLYYSRAKKWQSRAWDYSALRTFYFASKDISFASLFRMPSARLHLLYINDELAFFIILFECGNVLYLPHCAVNEKYARYSPGTLTHIECIKERARKSSFIYDMGSGDEQYKKWLGAGEYSLYMLTTE